MILEEYKYRIYDDSEYEGIAHYFRMEEGEARFEVLPQCLIIHPKLTQVGKDKLISFREKCYTLILQLMNTWDYDEVFMLTYNKKIVKLMSQGKAKPVGEIPMGYGTLYMLQKEEVQELAND